MLKRSTLIACLLFLLPMSGMASKQDLVIAAEKQSTYCIVVDMRGPPSVVRAARELQKNLERATGARLEIIDHHAELITPYISIGINNRSSKSGITVGDLETEAFRIVTHSGNLYILGVDTLTGEWTEQGGESHGTANGVYTFLENYLGVRWLMPGEIGWDVPFHERVVLPEIDHTEKPFFLMREISHLRDFTYGVYTRNVVDWKAHLKLGSSDNVRRPDSNRQDHWQHNWMWITDNREYFEKHPEWFAMNSSGERWFPDNHYAKLETTNPELIRYFADHALKTLKQAERPRAFSLTPNDAPSRWSESKESKAWYDPPVGEGRDTHEFKSRVPSKTSLVMKWYYDVASIVKKEYPEGRLSGFIYSDYLYPPVRFEKALPDNMYLILCGPNYGYELYREDARQRLSWLLEQWTRYSPGGIYYYDLPALLFRQEDADPIFNMAGTTAVITPPGIKILDFLFRELKENQVKGGYFYGAPAWSNAALTNYILAKKLWNPELSTAELQQDWLYRAYGEEAGKAMGKLYTYLENLYEKHEYIGYHLTKDMLEEIYADHLPELERLFLRAKEKTMTPVQRERLELLESNLIALQWRLKNAGLIAESYTSPLSRESNRVLDLLQSEHPDLILFPGVVTPASMFNRYALFPDISLVSDLSDSDESDIPELPVVTAALIYAAEDGEVRIHPQMLDHGAYAITYVVLDQNRNQITSGLFNSKTPVVFPVRQGQMYSLHIPPRQRRMAYPIRYSIYVEKAVIAESAGNSASVTFLDQEASLYMYSDKGNLMKVQDDEGNTGVMVFQGDPD